MAAKKKAARKKAARKPKRKSVDGARSEPHVERRGRPSIFSWASANEINERLSAGESLLRICRDSPNLPNAFTVRRWVVGIGIPKEHLAVFRANYEAARMSQADHMFEDIVELSNNADEFNQVHVNKSRLQVDSRKWVLARMNRVKYGDRSDLNVGGQADSPLATTAKIPSVEDMTPEQQKKWREFARSLISS